MKDFANMMGIEFVHISAGSTVEAIEEKLMVADLIRKFKQKQQQKEARRLKHFLIGCCYYPEHWKKEDMRRDMERIRALGFNTVRMGEFSWSMYEREEGKYDFSLLTDAVRLAQELSLNVILGTPTAAPPKWLIDKYPEVLCTNAKGVVMQHGSRQHHNHTSAVYLRYCAAITEAMVKNFCGFPNVIGWQIDNELNCHRNESHSQTDDIAFRKWLEDKYGTVERLNDAWGNRFWSLEFNSFSQITCPRPNPAYDNPSWMTDYYLFLSDSAIGYASVQTEIIRAYMPDAFITHNGYFRNLDYKKLTRECLDILAFDSYPSFQEKKVKSSGRSVAYRLAQTRSCSEQFLILEQEAGPGGQLSYLLPTPLPGQIRLWTYQSIAHGATGVIYFRYRTALYGAEQLWYGIYDHDGEENYRTEEIRQISEEIGRLGGLFLQERQHNEVAIFDDYHNRCVNQVECFVRDDSREIFMALNRQNIHADLIGASDDFGKYKVILFPHVTIADETLRRQIEHFTDKGGIALISARSGVKDLNAHYRAQKPPCIFREAAGCRVDWFTALPEYEKQSVVFDGKAYAVEDYYEMLTVENGEAVGTYTEGFCKEKPAIVKNQNVYYIGFYCRKDASLYADIIKKHVAVSEPIHADLEEVVIGSYRLCLNHGDSEIPLGGYDLLKKQQFYTVPPYGVVLIEHNPSK